MQPSWKLISISAFFSTNFVIILTKKFGKFFGKFSFSSVNLTKFANFLGKIHEIFDITNLKKKPLVRITKCSCDWHKRLSHILNFIWMPSINPRIFGVVLKHSNSLKSFKRLNIWTLLETKRKPLNFEWWQFFHFLIERSSLKSSTTLSSWISKISTFWVTFECVCGD
jgi:hypothetical protein